MRATLPNDANAPARVDPADRAAPRATDPNRRPISEDIRLEAKNVFKVFAQDPRPALAMLKNGRRKDEIYNETGAVVGVDDASFAVRTGEIFVIMGLSGSGKSTLVRLLNRLIEPSAGQVLLGGQDLVRMSRKELIDVRRREMSMVFQSFALLPHLSALDNAAFGLTLSGSPLRKRREAARAALAKVGLEQYAERHPHEMSGGMQQRVGLARALAKNPSIMFMDEAFSALDPLIRTEMQDELIRLQKEQQRTIIFISHDLDEAMRIGDRIAIMEGGRIVQVGTPYDILLNPYDDYVASFFKNVDLAKVLRACDVVRAEGLPIASAENTDSPVVLLRQLDVAASNVLYVVDAEGRYRGTLGREAVSEAVRLNRQNLNDLAGLDVSPIAGHSRLSDIMRDVARAPCPVPIVDQSGGFLGALSRSQLLNVLHKD
ncbi:glycine betaine/proline transport system ATP-binding protein [Arboricoccus pini]|uniref:Quaternary amine transport ATP-binding protein n=1 Tax=Arboricoccus pini TaxID=1963835 RepID=A0A212R963_9PROT|nr:glycine betaine/L-proline ABC transporter ATP-binding protein [Arboricoccus pini]SNB68588.1 glycine betaine/proline transport system ATP-binding protein [Arboricoccus pini]